MHPNSFDTPIAKPDLSKCKRCQGSMRVGIALANTLTAGMPDFLGQTDMRGQTMSYGGPGKLIPVSKCSACGWSVGEPATGGA